jgi:hypothetical protein
MVNKIESKCCTFNFIIIIIVVRFLMMKGMLNTMLDTLESGGDDTKMIATLQTARLVAKLRLVCYYIFMN